MTKKKDIAAVVLKDLLKNTNILMHVIHLIFDLFPIYITRGVVNVLSVCTLIALVFVTNTVS